MKLIHNSIFEYKNFLVNREWYHQRFDGCPMFIFAIADAEMLKEKRKPVGTYPKVRVCFFGEGKADWHLDMEDVDRATKRMISISKKDPKFSVKLLKTWKNDEKKFDNFFLKEFPKINLGKLSNAELLKLWNRYYTLAIKRLSSTGIIDHFALGSDKIIYNMIRAEVIKQSKGVSLKDSEIAGISAIATAPVHQSFINQAEIELLKIAAGKSKEALSDYQKRYFWLRNNYYMAHILPITHFEKEIQAWKRSKKDLNEEISKLEQTPKINKQKKKELFKKYRFSPLLRTLLKISEDFTWWQDERKRATYFNIHIGSAMLEEISKRTGYSVEQLKHVTGEDMTNIIQDQQPVPQELNARAKNSVFVITPRGYRVATGNDVQKIRDLMWGKKQSGTINDFRGLSASMGKASGPVKVVKSATEIGKVKKGDILVAVMTRPDYVPAMKKAAAIVTNEGGITSHAAIVSRELGIPCIIGTKIATEALKDGDRVLVDANHGVVKKLKPNI